MVPFSFAQQEWRWAQARALYWPRENALLVADLHLEKGSFFARFGQMLPPYDSRETLARIAAAIKETGARRVFCLGDSFHDAAGPERMEPHAAGMLAALTRATDWVWISGNHDSGVPLPPGGTRVEELDIGGLVLRHEAHAGSLKDEVSGHFHPKFAVTLRGRRVVRACAVASENRLILPAFGAFTGGMDAADPAILAALQPARAIHAVLPTAGRVVQVPLWQAA